MGLILQEIDSHAFTVGTEYWAHAILYLGGYVYVGLRTSPGKLLKINAANLSEYSVLTFPNDGLHDKIGQIRYSTSKGRIYVLFEETTNTVVAEVNPSDLSQSDVINNTDDCGAGSICLDESYLYVVEKNALLFYEYSMTTWAKGRSVAIDANGHACEYESDFVYITHNLISSPGLVTKVNLSNFSKTTQTFSTGDNAAADDFAIVGNYLWCGLEALNGHIIKITKADLSLEVIATNRTTACYGIQYDGTWLWAVYNGTPGSILRINPATEEIFVHAFSGNSPSEIAFGGGYIFVATYTNPVKVFKLQLKADVRPNLIRSFRQGSYATGKSVSKKRVTL